MDDDMEQNSVTKDILRFVRELFKKSSDIGSLTVKQIRVAYLEAKDKPELTVVEKSCFKPIIEKVFLEFQSQNEEPMKNDETEDGDIADQLDDHNKTTTSDIQSEMSSDNELIEEQDSDQHSDNDDLVSNSDSDSESDEPLKERDGVESSKNVEEVENIKIRKVRVNIERLSMVKDAKTEEEEDDDDDDHDDDKIKHVKSFNRTVTTSSASENKITEKLIDNKLFEGQETDNQSDSNRNLSVSEKKKRKRLISSSESDSELDKPLKQRKDVRLNEFESPVKGSPKKKKSHKISEKKQKSKEENAKTEDEDDDDETKHLNGFNGTITSSSTSENNITEKLSDNKSSDGQESDNQSDSYRNLSVSENKKRKRVISSSESDSELDKPLKQRKDVSLNELVSPVSGRPEKKKSHKIREKKRKSKKESVKNENKPPKKDSKAEESKELKLLKSCCRFAGLFIHYTKVFVDCSSDEEKEKVLLGLLKEAGLRGKPSVNACKKLRLKREEKKALEDLDTANIINSSGRSHRRSAGTVAEKPIPNTVLTEIKKSYSRLKGIIDSEESNSD